MVILMLYFRLESLMKKNRKDLFFVSSCLEKLIEYQGRIYIKNQCLLFRMTFSLFFFSQFPNNRFHLKWLKINIGSWIKISQSDLLLRIKN